MDNMISSGIETLRNLSVAAGTITPTTFGDGAQRFVVPEDSTVEFVRPIDPVLGTVRQEVALGDAPSFVAYVNRFKSPETMIFADLDGRRVSVVFDYHKPAAGDGERATADYIAHRAFYSTRVSEEWARWTSIDGKSIGQTAFAEFIEENLIDIRKPDGATVLEIATQLKAKKKVEFQSGVQLQNGAVSLVYKEDIETSGRGEMSVPAEIVIGVPIFHGGPKYEVRIFLRYRIEDGKLSFKIDVHRRRYLEQDAFGEFVKIVGDGTGIVPLLGKLV